MPRRATPRSKGASPSPAQGDEESYLPRRGPRPHRHRRAGGGAARRRVLQPDRHRRARRRDISGYRGPIRRRQDPAHRRTTRTSCPPGAPADGAPLCHLRPRGERRADADEWQPDRQARPGLGPERPALPLAQRSSTATPRTGTSVSTSSAQPVGRLLADRPLGAFLEGYGFSKESLDGSSPTTSTAASPSALERPAARRPGRRRPERPQPRLVRRRRAAARPSF